MLAALGLLAVTSLRSTPTGVDAGTAIRMDVADLVDRADLVFEGRVLATRTLQPAPGLIETEYTVAVDRTFWGPQLSQRVFRMPGGVLPDGRGLVLPGMPSLRVGEDALLFLSEAGSSGVRMPIGLAQGKFSVISSLSGARALTRRQGSLSTVDPASGTVQHMGTTELLDYAETIAEIRAAAERRVATGSSQGMAK